MDRAMLPAGPTAPPCGEGPITAAEAVMLLLMLRNRRQTLDETYRVQLQNCHEGCTDWVNTHDQLRAATALYVKLHNTARQRLAELRPLLHEADHACHVLNNPSLGDVAYDRLYQELIQLETAHPDLVTRVDLFFHPRQIANRLGADPLTTVSSWFNDEVWPWPGKPHAYVDRRLISGAAECCYQHARAVIADAASLDAKALVTSANFSETAQHHNFEAGWLTTSAPRAQQIHKQFAPWPLTRASSCLWR